MPGSLIVAGALTVLAGGAAEPASGPPEYGAGYEAGCRSGHVDASEEGRAIHYDAKAFEAESTYREGWCRGFLECLIQGRRARQPMLFDSPFLPAR